MPTPSQLEQKTPFIQQNISLQLDGIVVQSKLRYHKAKTTALIWEQLDPYYVTAEVWPVGYLLAAVYCLVMSMLSLHFASTESAAMLGSNVMFIAGLSCLGCFWLERDKSFLFYHRYHPSTAFRIWRMGMPESELKGFADFISQRITDQQQRLADDEFHANTLLLQLGIIAPREWMFMRTTIERMTRSHARTAKRKRHGNIIDIRPVLEESL